MLYQFIVTKNAKKMMEEGQRKLTVNENSITVLGETLEGCMEYAQSYNRMKEATLFFAQHPAHQIQHQEEENKEILPEIFLRNRGMKYKKCLPRKYSGGSAELAAAAMAENENKTIEKIAAEKAAILCFELWQDMIVSGNIPKAERYKKEFMTFYGEKAANSELYYMFLGFIGGTDFIKATEKK